MEERKNAISVENTENFEDKKSSFLRCPIGVASKQSKDFVLQMAAIYPLLDFIFSFISGFLNSSLGIYINPHRASLGYSIFLLIIAIADYRFLKRIGYQVKWYQLIIGPWYMYKKEKMCYGKLFWFYIFLVCFAISIAIMLIEEGII